MVINTNIVFTKYQKTKASRKNIRLSTIAVLATVAGAICFFPVFLVILVFVPGALNKLFVH